MTPGRQPHTRRILSNAIRWAEAAHNLRGLVLYGSTARSQDHDHSDVDLILVTRPGDREELWRDRLRVAGVLLGAPVVWSHDLPWQGPYRFQAWAGDLSAVDLTFDDGRVEDHEVLDGGAEVIYGDLELPAPEARPTAESLNRIEELDGSTWIWFLGLHGWLRQQRFWDVYHQLVMLIDARIKPLYPDPAELGTALPRGLREEALLSALRHAVDLYEQGRARSGLPPTTMPIATKIRQVIHG